MKKSVTVDKKGLKVVYYCNVQSKDFSWDWVRVEADSFKDAYEKAEKPKDVIRCVEVSIIPGGIVT
jgi:hypothetical protein